MHWKLVIDCAEPHALAGFWAEALGYVVEDNSAFIEGLLAAERAPAELTVEVGGKRAWRHLVGVRHPEDPYEEETGIGKGRRLLFIQVPEPKTVKNRLHMDLHPGAGKREAEVARLVALGASVLREVDEPGGRWTVLSDIERNEFCVS
ncbi:hypothetical protein NX801_26200 [Streptomyces sp. LP05-1]|uniref:Glyoxalase-like domain-containing protein n=1 Tax=Streptomyces pyxinae TaxID=2970734 RepID=A0ABT2CNQ1_9ACTN|nr:VOC family protein [Streptomyces sp. LP05-1]MCS0639072.1 hypothetical protein [Streptomyces sp. LP05-1]